MKPKVELYSGTYRNYAEGVYRNIRKEAFGEDIGQNSWLTATEYRDFISLLKIAPGVNVLEIASGSGGPAVFMVKETGCRVTGLEINEDGVNQARITARENGLGDHMTFLRGDASEMLPFPDNTFDVVISIDSINHLKDRSQVLKEFRRVLKTGGRMLYTDPIVVTGILTNEEIAVRSSIGFFLFVPVGENERLIKQAGFSGLQSRDVTDNMATVSKNWFTAREKRKDDLHNIEEENNFKGLQSFLEMVNILSGEKRLSRFMFTAVK